MLWIVFVKSATSGFTIMTSQFPCNQALCLLLEFPSSCSSLTRTFGLLILAGKLAWNYRQTLYLFYPSLWDVAGYFQQLLTSALHISLALWRHIFMSWYFYPNCVNYWYFRVLCNLTLIAFKFYGTGEMLSYPICVVLRKLINKKNR